MTDTLELVVFCFRCSGMHDRKWLLGFKVSPWHWSIWVSRIVEEDMKG